jgi:hypothetical protein
MDPPFLTSAVDGCERSVSRPGHFTRDERSPDTHWIGDYSRLGGLPEPVWTLQRREKCYTYRNPNPGRPAHPSLYRFLMLVSADRNM